MTRFVSAGTTDEPVERDAEWDAAQEAIEATKRRKEAEGQQAGGKSLYETLSYDESVAAKQEAFEESIRLKNQFRALDEDEVEFLDSVLESTRAKEAAVKRETSEQLELFRKQREEAERAEKLEQSTSGVSGDLDSERIWLAKGGRKRKKDVGKELKGVKLRKTSSVNETAESPITPVDGDQGGKTAAILPESPKQENEVPQKEEKADAKPSAAVGLGLGHYSSDDDD